MCSPVHNQPEIRPIKNRHFDLKNRWITVFCGIPVHNTGLLDAAQDSVQFVQTVILDDEPPFLGTLLNHHLGTHSL